MIEKALQYLDAGLCVLPALVAQKRPALPGWKQWQSKLPTAAEVRTWFAREAPDAACCLIAGSVSGNLEMLDFDQHAELFPAWEKLVQSESPGLFDRLVIEQSQSGGLHVIYRCGEGVSSNLHLAQRALAAPDDKPVTIGGKTYRPRKTNGSWEIILTLIETRGEGGLFLCHPSPGYELLQGSFVQMPVLTAAEREILLEAAWSLNELVPPPVAVPPDPNPHIHGERPGDAFNQRGDVAALLVKHGWTLVRDGENQYWRRPGKDRGWSATLKGRVFYVFSSNGAPFDGPKAYGPFAVYTMLEHGGDYTRAASALRARGHGASSLPPPTIATAPPPADEKLFITTRQLLADYPEMRRPVIHGLLRRGETMNLISAPKIGKSWLVLDLALSVVTGRDWLGQFKCERGDVLILDNELHPETLASRIPKVAQAKGLGPDQYADRLCVRNLRGQLRDIFSLGEYFRRLERGRFRVIICDAFYRFLPRDTDENDNGTMANLYNVLDNYADHTGACFVLIHHSTKGNQSLKAVTDVGAGAGSQGRAADAHIVLRRHEEDDAVVLEGEVRAWPRFAAQCLRWSFPLWMPAPELDPAQLRSEKPRKRKADSETEPTDVPQELSPAEFARRFVHADPRSSAVILDEAVGSGITRRQAERKLRVAEEMGLVHRWFFGGNRQKLAAVPQPEGETSV